jgi:hypothetical protein
VEVARAVLGLLAQQGKMVAWECGVSELCVRLGLCLERLALVYFQELPYDRKHEP